MRITWNEYTELSNVLSDEDFSLLTLLILHPEMNLNDIWKWCVKKVDENDNVVKYSIEMIRIKLLSLEWKIKRFKNEYDGSFRKYKEENKVHDRKTRDKEIIEEMVNRFLQLYNIYLDLTKCMDVVLSEYNYKFSRNEFKEILKKYLGKENIKRLEASSVLKY